MELEEALGQKANFGLVGGRMNSLRNAEPAVSSAQHSCWAKGTGFGTGTTQQHWDVDLHVLKREQDEQNVTHLLKVYFSSVLKNWCIALRVLFCECIFIFFLLLFCWLFIYKDLTNLRV